MIGLHTHVILVPPYFEAFLLQLILQLNDVRLTVPLVADHHVFHLLLCIKFKTRCWVHSYTTRGGKQYFVVFLRVCKRY